MSKRIEEEVLHIAQPIASELGYEVLDVEYNKVKDSDNELVIYIDKEGGIAIDDCERLSKLLDEPLDKQDPIPDSYVLCVSSPGLDRPLRKDGDFKRAIGKTVDVKLYKKTDGKKDFTGTLSEFDEHTVLITSDKGKLSFSRVDIALIRLHIDF